MEPKEFIDVTTFDSPSGHREYISPRASIMTNIPDVKIGDVITVEDELGSRGMKVIDVQLGEYGSKTIKLEAIPLTGIRKYDNHS